MHGFDRTDRVSHLIQREISQIIANEVRDDRVFMVSVTGAEVSRDFRNARIFVSALGEQKDIDAAIDALDAAAGFIRSILRERIVLKHIPMLTFKYDPSIVNGVHMDALLNEIKKNEP
jgi:ribosome-binding factor A